MNKNPFAAKKAAPKANPFAKASVKKVTTKQAVAKGAPPKGKGVSNAKVMFGKPKK